MDDGPELSDVIAQLRASLSNAQKDGEGHNLRFNVEDVEIELQVAVTKEKSGGGGIKFWVLDAKAEGKLSDAITQKIKLHMTVVDTATHEGKEKAAKSSGLIGSEGKK